MAKVSLVRVLRNVAAALPRRALPLLDPQAVGAMVQVVLQRQAVLGMVRHARRVVVGIGPSGSASPSLPQCQLHVVVLVVAAQRLQH